MAKKTIRIPRTTARFVTGLAGILRDQLGLRVTEHEHWTFEQVADWEECGAKGKCSQHGYSERYQADLDKRGLQEGTFNPVGNGPCYQYDISVYLATGQARVDGKKVELRAHIKETHSDTLGDLCRVRIWVQNDGGEIQKGVYSLREDGRPYLTEELIPDYPPNRIVFWREEVEKQPEEPALV